MCAAVPVTASANRRGRSLISCKCGNDTGDVSHGVLLGLAYPDRIAQRRGSNRFRMANGGGAVVAEHDGLAKADFIAIALLDNAQADAKVFLAAVTHPRRN